MPQLPTISAPSVQRAQYAGVPASLESALAPIRGSQAIAGAIGQAGQVLGEFAVKSAQSREEATLVQQQSTVSNMYAAYEEERAKTPNSSDWVPLWEKHKKAIADTISKSSQTLGPNGKARSSAMLTSWIDKQNIKVRTEAAVQGVREDKRAFMGAAMDEFGRGELLPGIMKLNEAKKLGLLSDAEYHEAVQEGQQRSTFANVQKEIDKNPAKAEEMLKDPEFAPNLSQANRTALQNSAHNRVQAWRAEFSQEIGEEIFNLVENGVGNSESIEKKINEAVQSGQMLASTANGHLRALRREIGQKDAAAFASGLWDEAMTIDSSLPAAEQRRMEMSIRERMGPLSPELQRPIIEALEDRRKEKPGDKKIAEDALKHIDGIFDSGLLGPKEMTKKYQVEKEPETIGNLFLPERWEKKNPRAGQPILDEEGKETIVRNEFNEQVLDEERTAEYNRKVTENKIFVNRIKREVYEYAKMHPEKTPEELVAYADSLIDERRNLTQGQPLVNSLTGTR